MKKSILVFLFSLIFTAVTSSAQNRAYKGLIEVTPLQLEQIGDSLHVSVLFDLSKTEVFARRSIDIVPTLIGATRVLELPQVAIKGRINYLTSQREIALMSKKEHKAYQLTKPYSIVRGFKCRDEKNFRYNITVPFQAWMVGAKLDLRADICGCGNVPQSILISSRPTTVQLEPAIVPYVIRPYIAFVQPVPEPIKRREMVGEAFLDFIVNRTDIRPDYMNNPRELKKITDMITELSSDKAITIKKIKVLGYASPEGSLAGNQRLSEGRATALVNYLMPRFTSTRKTYDVKFGGENWVGLQTIMQTSNEPFAEKVLALVSSFPDPMNATQNAKLKKSIVALDNGIAYRIMLKEYYPSLRKAVCVVDFEVRSFNSEEARQVFKTHPQNLSLNEMFMAANTYEIGSAEYINIFNTAVKLFPEDQTANLNAAASALINKNIKDAEYYLAKVDTKTPQYYNAMGVLALYQEDFVVAEYCFKTAISEGLVQAEQNIEELNKKLDNIKQINIQQARYQQQ